MMQRFNSIMTLSNEAERYRLFVSGVVDYAIYMLSPEGIVITWNAGAQRFKGYTKEEIIGQHFSRFYTEEDKATNLPSRALQTALEKGSFEDEGWRVRKDGTRFWASVVIDPICDAEGMLVGFAKVTRDMTERRDAAISLEKAKETLFQSQKMEAIGKLTGGVAHDFNNLLCVIVNGLSVLSKGDRSPGERRIIDSMERAAAQGAALTQQLLAFARQQPLKQDKCDINRVIASFEAVLRRASNRTIFFNIELGPRLPLVLIDTAQFEAALLNLIVNARDATPDEGSITLRTDSVQLGEHEVGKLPAGCYVQVTIKDTGQGMPPDVVTRAIEPFFTTKPVGKGTGLGLSQVYGLVQQSNGDMRIESEVGKGTAISLYLPIVSGDIADEEDASEKALIVDDQPDVLDMAVELFRTLGYETFAANSGEEALEILKRNPCISVLFSDVVMPGISGMQLGMKARELVPGIKVILASGYAAPGLGAEHGGLDQFPLLTKPYRISDIVRKLRKADMADRPI
jgi:PAS domain S-box-containing protein